MNDLETKAIRTQMNPHFIFNALNTLQRFILEEDIANANSYLTKFSKLLRKVLESGNSESISLKEELEILKSYVEIEQLRFDKSFEFSLVSEINFPEQIQIPFMLIQPFVENAIWHGLLPKKDQRTLNIHFSDADENRIRCCIEDNGVGRKFSFSHRDPFKKKSMAIDFIQQRLDILQKATGINCFFTITDKENAQGQSEGTFVEILIPKMK
jgi:LytS/YehU family sensor histidine kinase